MSDRSGSRGAASPVVVFLCLLFLLAGITGVVIWTGQIDGQPIPPGPVPSASPERSPDLTLTDEEAVAVFKRLDAGRIEVYVSLDASALDTIFTESSATGRRVRREIRVLASDGVHSETRFDTHSLTVVDKTPTEIRLRQVVVVRPEFRDSDGDDVTGHAPDERQVIEWSLRNVTGRWLIHDSRVLRARVLNS